MATTIKIDDALKARLQNLANLQDRSPYWLMKEAKDWLDGWGTHKEQEVPKCYE